MTVMAASSVSAISFASASARGSTDSVDNLVHQSPVLRLPRAYKAPVRLTLQRRSMRRGRT